MDMNALGMAILIGLGIYLSLGLTLTITGSLGLRSILRNGRKLESAGTISALVGTLVFVLFVVIPLRSMSELMGVWFGLLFAYGLGMPLVAWLAKPPAKSKAQP